MLDFSSFVSLVLETMVEEHAAVPSAPRAELPFLKVRHDLCCVYDLT